MHRSSSLRFNSRLSGAIFVPLIALATPLSVLGAPAVPTVPVSTAPVLPQDLAAVRANAPLPNAVWVENLDLRNMTAGWQKPRAGKSIEGKPLTLKGIVYPHGIGTHPQSQMTIDLKGVAERFLALVGVDDETEGKGAVIFTIHLDGKKVADSGPIKGGEEPKLMSVDLTRAKRMVMSVANAPGEGWNGHADWAGAMIVMDDDAATQRPESVDINPAPLGPKFPPLRPAPAQPVINGPRIIGASPRRPFLYLVPTTGKAPLTYSSTGLPPGLKLDPRTGIISGQIAAAGTYDFRVVVTGPAGKAVRPLTIMCGERKLALTPPMGWNAWNVYGESVTADKIREQVDWLVQSGLAARGYQYVMIDDTWQARRDKDGTIGPNRRFGDIKSLADYVHSKGLKLGIYSSPNLETCSGFTGSLGHEDKDAALYASWGIDYLKYDWCQVGSSKKETTPEIMKAAYARMRSALDKVNRDIVFTMTPYGFGNAWEWGEDVGANSWWTSAGIQDTWESIRDNGFGLHERAKYAGPGHWNDPGWLMLGKIGSGTPHFSNLKPSEQMVQVSLWSLLAAPLVISCDLTQLNPNNFYPITTSLLANEEVIAVNQDALGRAATRVAGGGDEQVWAKPLLDGTLAVGLFNNRGWAQEVSVKWQSLGLSGSQPVRDLWYHKDLGEFPDSFTISLPRHSVALLKIGKPLSPANQVTSWSKPAYIMPTWKWDGLRWAYSRSGQEWVLMPGDKTRLKTTVGEKQMRDTSIARGPDGTYHMVWTTGNKEQGFGYASSKDLLTWTEPVMIPVEKGVLSGGVKHTRQPDVFYDRKAGHFLVTWSAARQVEPPKGFRLYAMTTKDFKTFSDPKLFYDPGYSIGDGTIVESGGQYHLIFREEEKRLLKVSTATDADGPYEAPSPPLPTGKDVDSPNVVKLNNEWLLYFSRSGNPGGTGVLRSKDLKTWEDVSAKTTFPKDYRYGTRLAVSEKTLQDLLRAY